MAMSNFRPPRTGDRLVWKPDDNDPDLSLFYTHLNEPQLSDKLKELSVLGTSGDTDYATLQPSRRPADASQDRYFIQDWRINGKNWRFRAIFDGHGGHDAANYTAEVLPKLILENLDNLVKGKENWDVSEISQLLVDTVVDFDNSIGAAVLNLFPGKSIHDSSDEEVQKVINDPSNLSILLRALRGTTALIALVDPASANLWVASLGDCTAILGTRKPDGTWLSRTLSHNHNGANTVESDKVLFNHPGEPNCVENDRVLGAIAVTRAIGDFAFKLPRIYTTRVLLSCEEGTRVSRRVKEMVPRILTPPYVSNVPEVTHASLGSGDPAFQSPSSVLLLFSDGLGDLYNAEFEATVSTPGFWNDMFKRVMGEEAPSELNAALRFLRAGLGGSDTGQVSRLLTTEFSERWMDDTTVLVQQL